MTLNLHDLLAHKHSTVLMNPVSHRRSSKTIATYTSMCYFQSLCKLCCCSSHQCRFHCLIAFIYVYIWLAILCWSNQHSYFVFRQFHVQKLSAKTTYHKWDILLFQLVHSSKCWNNTLIQTENITLNILPISSFTNPLFIWHNQCSR